MCVCVCGSFFAPIVATVFLEAVEKNSFVINKNLHLNGVYTLGILFFFVCVLDSEDDDNNRQKGNKILWSYVRAEKTEIRLSRIAHFVLLCREMALLHFGETFWLLKHEDKKEITFAQTIHWKPFRLG